MTVLSSGTDNIVAQSGVTIAAPDSSFIPPAGTYTNQTVTYNLISSAKSNVYYQVQAQSLSVVELNTLSITPDLSCSFDGTTSITYSISR